jgi:hypothetical protein
VTERILGSRKGPFNVAETYSDIRPQSVTGRQQPFNDQIVLGGDAEAELHFV